MRIAIEALGIDKPGGGRSATLNLLKALFAIDTNHQYFVFLSRREKTLEITDASVEQIIIKIKNRFLARIWAQLALPWLLRQMRVDLVHFVKDLGIFLSPCKMVITIHDLATVIHPTCYPRIDVIYWRFIEPLTLKQADRIIAVSYKTAHDLERYYGLAKDKISVIHNSCDSIFKPKSEDLIIYIRRKYALPPRTIIHVGSISRKKNLTTLVKAFHLLKRDLGFDGKLVLVGRTYRKGQDKEVRKQITTLGLQEEIIFTGPVPDADLPLLYNSAMLAAFPSLYEGFGIAPLEAMACGVPVITSKVGALVEVVGDAALFIENPLDENEWAAAMGQIMKDHVLREEMRNKGLKRAKHFSAEKSALQTLSLYEELIS
jgi:glycosyltransferase involved in cell wall biosynthesis